MSHIIQPHRNLSKAVELFSQIENEAKALRELSNRKDFQGLHKSCLGLHHAQVSEDPYNFFVLAEETVKFFPHWLIINPKIISKDQRSKFIAKEGCMSYPFRPFGKVKRYGCVDVEFDILRHNLFRQTKLKHVTARLQGLASEIFQHEFDHSMGKYVYD